MKCKHVLIPVAVVIAVIISWWFYPTSKPSNTLQVEKQPTTLPIQDKQLTKPKIPTENIHPETNPLKVDTVDSAISDIDKSDIDELFQDILDESTPKVGNRDYVYPQYSRHVLADGGKAKKFVGEVLENFKGVEEIKFSTEIWNSGDPDNSKPDITGVVVTIRGNDMIGEKDGNLILKYVDGLRMLYKNGSMVHMDGTEEGAPIKIQAMLQRFPWDNIRTVSIQQDNDDGSIVEKEFVEISTKLNGARALIDTETMELRRLDYVQEAKEGGRSQLLPIQMEYFDYVDIEVSPDKTVRFPSRIKSVFNRTRHEQFVLKDFAIKMDSNSVED